MNSFKIKDSFLYDYQGTKQDIVIPEGVTGICEEAFAGCSGLIVHAPKDSFAEKYAKENGIPF
ncbi:MAG: hypothetical protein IJD13_09325 [Oscillospiraceae bacterium]|nr:hypothetical protein [Oscillospiraceae bacterium]